MPTTNIFKALLLTLSAAAAFGFAATAAGAQTTAQAPEPAAKSAGNVQVQWLGQAAFKITTVVGR